ncbi:hypothetical protein Cme02nite_55670 [Catellatospora methionotrophica]|uniref:Uncharacterized protein n=1 Tax=Catellatospora methionotrophica TaxID=121620 RepID=A0A8J3LQZ4_9ACTN|nr:hypothetical protein [Catellatospora methionotrophica]GIG17235.1 hypothetical protein Cme02nite_55670 [Catellatospora methionotrophica]
MRKEVLLHPGARHHGRAALLPSPRHRTAGHHCPQHETWHLTSRATWHERPPAPPVATLGYRRAIAALLADRGSVVEQELVAITACGADPRHVPSIVTELLNSWCRWGLVYPDGQTVIAVNVPALRAISQHGWSVWVREHPTGDAAAPSPADNL